MAPQGCPRRPGLPQVDVAAGRLPRPGLGAAAASTLLPPPPGRRAPPCVSLCHSTTDTRFLQRNRRDESTQCTRCLKQHAIHLRDVPIVQHPIIYVNAGLDIGYVPAGPDAFFRWSGQFGPQQLIFDFFSNIFFFFFFLITIHI